MKTSPSARGASKKRARSSSLTSLLVAAEPLLVALLALRFDPSASVTGIRLAGLFIGMMGVVALLGLDVGGDRFKLVGAVLVLLAAAGYATGALLVKRPVFAGIPSLGVVAAECAAASVVLTPLALVHLPTSPGVWLWPALRCWDLSARPPRGSPSCSVAEVGASRGTVFTYANPAIAVVLGIVVLGEPVYSATVAGFLLIIAGSWLSTRGTRGGRPVPPEAPLHVDHGPLAGPCQPLRGRVEGARRDTMNGPEDSTGCVHAPPQVFERGDER